MYRAGMVSYHIRHLFMFKLQFEGEYNGIYILGDQDEKNVIMVYRPGSNQPVKVVEGNIMAAQLDGKTLYYITASDKKVHSLEL